MIPDLCIIRPGKVLDLPYITESWIRSNSRTDSARDAIKVYYEEARLYISKILDCYSDIVKIKIACLPDDEDAILGWAVYEVDPDPEYSGIIHYVYVRNEARRNGIAKELLSEVLGQPDITFTHKPALHGFKIPDTWAYNPYLAIRHQ